MSTAPDGTRDDPMTEGNTATPGISIKPQIKPIRLKNNISKFGIKVERPKFGKSSVASSKKRRSAGGLLHNKKTSNVAMKNMKKSIHEVKRSLWGKNKHTWPGPPKPLIERRK